MDILGVAMALQILAAAGSSAWPGGLPALRFVKNCGSMIDQITTATPPMASQVQEKISNRARAQRRARMEPMPSQTIPTAIRPYKSMPGKTV